MSCDWPIDRTCLTALPVVGTDPGNVTQDEYDAALAQRNAAEDTAVNVLWALSGRQYGICPVTVRPCVPGNEFDPRVGGPSYSRYANGGYSGTWGWLDDGGWINATCGCFGGQCTIGGPRAIHLPGPAVDVTAVTVAGVDLDPSQYVLEGDVLYRIGANWPGQNLGRPLGEPGTWSVDYTRGVTPPAGAANLTGLLALEFYSACSGGKCRLPRNVTGVTRNGVTYQIYDPNKIYEAGKTGLSEVDLWLSAVNPAHLMQAPSVR